MKLALIMPCKMLAVLLLGLAVMAGVGLFFPVKASAAPPGRDFMSWRLIEHERVGDGGMVAVFELLLPERAKSVENLEVFYVVKPWQRVRRSRRVFGPAEVYAKELSGPSSAPRLSIYCGRYARLEIMAGALIDGRFQSARTMLNTYGDSGSKDPEAKPVQAGPLWPGIGLGRTGSYQAVTGEPLRFEIEADYRGLVSVRAFDQGREVTAELVDLKDGAYSYTSPLDPLLAAPGYSVKRDVVFVAALGDKGGLLSYYLPVNRSYYGRSYLKPGLAVVGLTVLISLGAVRRAGGRFKWR